MTHTPAPRDAQDAIDEWIRRRWNADVAPGSGEISVDAAGYSSGAWCTILVAWRDATSRERAVILKDDAWQYEFGAIVREVVAVDRELAALVSTEESPQ